jgi:hypothetical protein
MDTTQDINIIGLLILVIITIGVLALAANRRFVNWCRDNRHLINGVGRAVFAAPGLAMATYALFTSTPSQEEAGLLYFFLLSMMTFFIIFPSLEFLRHCDHKRNKQ